MHAFVALVILAVAIGSTYGCGSSKECPKGWTREEGKCYKLFSDNKGFDDAEAYCRTQGGHLACPKSDAENAAIHEVAKKRAWIGIHDKGDSEGTFRCTSDHINVKDKGAGGFSKWHDREPNDHGSGEDCTEIYFSNWGEKLKDWNDVACSHKKAFVCEYHFD